MNPPTDSKPDLLLRILRFSLVSLLVLYFSLQYVSLSGNLFIVNFLQNPVLPLVAGGLIVSNLLLVYMNFAHFVERRSASELTLPGMGCELGLGLLFGPMLSAP